MVLSLAIMSSSVIATASPILIPVLISKSIKAASRVNSFWANTVKDDVSISKH